MKSPVIFQCSIRSSIEIKSNLRPCKLLQHSRKLNFSFIQDFYINCVRMLKPTGNITWDVDPAMKTEICVA